MEDKEIKTYFYSLN